ncbi:MAG: ribosomal-processing cysteine protease Prp [Lachnospiraceae bacterium]|nr:ribosomal-processing cysteine protease Prp [Lachnospiraceae bacterium]
MIRVTVFKEDGKYVSFICDGHAGYAKHGEDIVCAAVSMLVINTVNSILEFTDDKIDVSSDEDRGLISVDFKNSPSERAKLLMDSMVLGLSGVKEEYDGRYIDISVKEE